MKRLRIAGILILVSFVVWLLAAWPRPLNSMSLIYFNEALSNTLHSNCSQMPSNEKPLLQPGSYLEADTRFALLQIQSLDTQTRRYRWRCSPDDNWSEETITLKGGHGSTLVYPGNRSENLLTFLGLKRNVIAAERDQDCKSQADLDFWLKNYGLTHGAVYTHSGLVVGCDPDKPDFQVIQLTLNGVVPKNLPGAHDSAIRIWKQD